MVQQERPQRGTVGLYLGVIAVNLLVLPTWFAPGRFPLSSRVAFVAVSVLLIAFCAWKVTGLLGGNPLRRRGPHPSVQLREGYGDDLYEAPGEDPDTDEFARLDDGDELALCDEGDDGVLDERAERAERDQRDQRDERGGGGDGATTR